VLVLVLVLVAGVLAVVVLALLMVVVVVAVIVVRVVVVVVGRVLAVMLMAIIMVVVVVAVVIILKQSAESSHLNTRAIRDTVPKPIRTAFSPTHLLQVQKIGVLLQHLFEVKRFDPQHLGELHLRELGFNYVRDLVDALPLPQTPRSAHIMQMSL
jgi:c-di-AMP phosphodiesterase-like protein